MIDVQELRARRGDTLVLEGLSLRIEDGEFLVVTGPNGSGKTTLVRHLNGLFEPDSGAVFVNGIPVAENPLAARTAVGMVFQSPEDCFVAATVGADVAFGPENLGLSREEINRRVRDALDAVDMEPHCETRIDRLSGGQKARVAIAGALAMEPSHLVLDEPFSGLDQPARESVLRRLGSLSAAGTSVIVVTHDLRDLAALADRIIVIADGTVALEPDATDDERLADFGVRPC